MRERNHRAGAGPWAPASVAWWDTYAFWRAWREHGERYDFEPALFPDQARWQFIDGYRREELAGAEPIFTHYTLPKAHRQGPRGNGKFEVVR